MKANNMDTVVQAYYYNHLDSMVELLPLISGTSKDYEFIEIEFTEFNGYSIDDILHNEYTFYALYNTTVKWVLSLKRYVFGKNGVPVSDIDTVEAINAGYGLLIDSLQEGGITSFDSDVHPRLMYKIVAKAYNRIARFSISASKTLSIETMTNAKGYLVNNLDNMVVDTIVKDFTANKGDLNGINPILLNTLIKTLIPIQQEQFIGLLDKLNSGYSLEPKERKQLSRLVKTVKHKLHA